MKQTIANKGREFKLPVQDKSLIETQGVYFLHFSSTYTEWHTEVLLHSLSEY